MRKNIITFFTLHKIYQFVLLFILKKVLTRSNYKYYIYLYTYNTFFVFVSYAINKKTYFRRLVCMKTNFVSFEKNPNIWYTFQLLTLLYQVRIPLVG